MPPGFSLPRFCSTFGLLFLLWAVLSVLAAGPIKRHIIETQHYTLEKTKSSILSYQTPNFPVMARNILHGHMFHKEDLDSYAVGFPIVRFYQKAVELYPDLFEMHYFLGVCYFWLGETGKAEASLRRSLEINPAFFWTYYNLGLLYFKEGKIDAAMAVFGQAKRIPPQVTEAVMYAPEAFQIIWRFMPDPQQYIRHRLEQAEQQIDYFLLVGLAAKSGQARNFDPDAWHPVFF